MKRSCVLAATFQFAVCGAGHKAVGVCAAVQEPVDFIGMEPYTARAVRRQMGIVSAVYSQSEILQKEARLPSCCFARSTRSLFATR
jgi:hypothetical protein